MDIISDMYKPYMSTNPPTEEFGMPTEEFGSPVLTRSLVYDSRELYSRIADGLSDPPSCATDCTTGAVPECNLWYHDGKSALLSEVQQQSTLDWI